MTTPANGMKNGAEMNNLNATIPRWRAWIMGARPKTLPAAVAPVVVGSALAYADGYFAAGPALAALAAALLIQICTNLANDYFDCIKGIDVPDRKGPIRVAQSGLIPLNELKAGILIVIGAIAGIGIYLIWVGGWPILAIGVASLLAAVAYSGGPYPLSTHGQGDLFAFLFFGPAAVFGAYYVQALRSSPLILPLAVAIGALTTAILIVNNYRDIDTDRRAGKRSLAVIIGPAATRIEFVLTLALAYAMPALVWLAGLAPAWILLPWLSTPLAAPLARALWRTDDGAALNETLAGAARLDLIFSLLLTIGLIVG